MNENTVLNGYTGRHYRLTNLLGKGGEGSVFETEDPELVIKIYDAAKPSIAERMPELEKKLLYMAQTIRMKFISKQTQKCLVSWPQDVVYENGKFVGYLMPKVSGAKSILLVNRGGASAKRVIPDYDWSKAALVAQNLAKVVRALHELDVVIGDMNNSNILVYPNCDVAIIDVDSFDIRTKDGAHHYKCRVGMEAYLPPELQGCDLREERNSFSKATDDFALAVHIFQLLMNNIHPFNVKVRDTSKSSPHDRQEYNISTGSCPFVRHVPECDIPMGAPKLEQLLPGEIVKDFDATFNYVTAPGGITAGALQEMQRQRTSANQWYQDLSRMNAQFDQMFARCMRNPMHYYLISYGKCALCEAGDRVREVYQQAALNPGQNPGQNPPQNPGQNPEQTPPQNPGQNPPQNPPQNPGQNPPQNPGQSPTPPSPKKKSALGKIIALILAAAITWFVYSGYFVPYDIRIRVGKSPQPTMKITKITFRSQTDDPCIYFDYIYRDGPWAKRDFITEFTLPNGEKLSDSFHLSKDQIYSQTLTLGTSAQTDGKVRLRLYDSQHELINSATITISFSK